jgi:molecular chaperone DnaK
MINGESVAISGPNDQGRIFGIHLGNTNCCIASLDEHGRVLAHLNLAGKPVTPAVVLFEGPTSCYVGDEAKDPLRSDSWPVAERVKSHLGTGWSLTVGDREYSAAAIAALILQGIATDISTEADAPVRQVVMTVPCYFGTQERTEIREAVEGAGMALKCIISEQVAALLAYSWDRIEDGDSGEVVVVYRLGGTTFDVSILRRTGDSVALIAHEANQFLGGDDWDSALADYLAQKFLADHPDAEDVLSDLAGRAEIHRVAEDVKCRLSRNDTCEARIFLNHVLTQMTVTRDRFEELTSHLLDRTVEMTASVVDGARAADIWHIDRVLLVGGMTKVPSVARKLHEVFGFEPEVKDPDLAIARGAAIFGADVHVRWSDESPSGAVEGLIDVIQDLAVSGVVGGAAWAAVSAPARGLKARLQKRMRRRRRTTELNLAQALDLAKRCLADRYGVLSTHTLRSQGDSIDEQGTWTFLITDSTFEYTVVVPSNSTSDSRLASTRTRLSRRSTMMSNSRPPWQDDK